MRKVYVTMLALLLSVAALWGQTQNGELSGSFSGKVKYAPGKNVYLLDEYKLDYTYKTVMGDPVCISNVVWTRSNSFSTKKGKISYSQLSDFSNLKKRFDLIAPTSIDFKFIVLFYSEQSKAYIASAKTSLTVPFLEKAGSSVSPLVPVNLSWKESFSDVVVGKQTKEKPGVVIADAALDAYFKASNIQTGKWTKDQKFYRRTMSNLFSNADRIDIVKVEADVKWNDKDYDFIVDDYNRRNEVQKALTAKDTAKASKIYFGNRTTIPAISTKDSHFWNATIAPVEVWMDAIDEADKLYEQQKWADADVYYKKVIEANPDLTYAADRIEKIQKYFNYKSTRNVGSLEFVYVEGGQGIKSFYMSKNEITQRQWRRVMKTNRAPSYFNKGGGDMPVENVTWEEAIAFVKELSRQTGMNYRLPRLEEWNFAAKGGNKASNTQYSGSDNLDNVAWCAYNSGETTHPVGQKTANELGIHDMTGNVSEWVADNAQGSDVRMIKGGSWADDATNCLISAEEMYTAKQKNNHVGFRVCQDE